MRLSKPMPPDKALIKLEELCARSEHCTYELMTKLKNWKVGETESRKILASLRRNRFLDDSRYATFFVRDRYRFAKWGRIKIRLHLRAKRISDDIIDEAFDEIDEDEYFSILCELAKAKITRLGDDVDFEARQKIYRWLLSRGYESSLISKAMR